MGITLQRVRLACSFFLAAASKTLSLPVVEETLFRLLVEAFGLIVDVLALGLVEVGGGAGFAVGTAGPSESERLLARVVLVGWNMLR
jgi:hypothetical protein